MRNVAAGGCREIGCNDTREFDVSVYRKTIAVWFSCGAASAVAAKLTLDKYGADNRVLILNNPVAEEDYDNRRFADDVAKWIGSPIITVTNSQFPDARCVDVWNDRRFMSGPLGAPCTVLLKKHARHQWENDNHTDWHVLGFTVDEVKRHERFTMSERDNVLPVLIDAGLTKQDCVDVLLRAGIEPPRVYALGFPNANCIGCVKASSPTYWNLVRRTFPDAFWERAMLSRSIGARLVRVNGERIFLDELDPSVVGRPLSSMNVECGTFCEEAIT